MLDEGAPLFLQIADELVNDIADGSLAEGEQVPSSNEFAAFHGVNPATAAKGINVLVDQGLVEKRRGVGMFVKAGAREAVISRRRAAFADAYVSPLLAEAERLGISTDTLVGMVRRAAVGESVETSAAQGDGR